MSSNKVSPHVIQRLRERCGIETSAHQVVVYLQTAKTILRSAGGEWLFMEVEGRYAVLVRQQKTVKTALTPEHAFSNCPKGMFYFLVTSGYLIVAMNLRLFYVSGVLPPQHGSDEGNYKYPKGRAKILWDAFRWQKK